MGHPEAQDTHLDSWALTPQTHLLIPSHEHWQCFCAAGKDAKTSRCWFEGKEARVAGERSEACLLRKLHAGSRVTLKRKGGGRERHYLEPGCQGGLFLGQSMCRNSWHLNAGVQSVLHFLIQLPLRRCVVGAESSGQGPGGRGPTSNPDGSWRGSTRSGSALNT